MPQFIMAIVHIISTLDKSGYQKHSSLGGNVCRSTSPKLQLSVILVTCNTHLVVPHSFYPLQSLRHVALASVLNLRVYRLGIISIGPNISIISVRPSKVHHRFT